MITSSNPLLEIEELFDKASKDNSKAKQYIRKARRIAMKKRLKLPAELKRRFCKNCLTYLTSKNSRTRVREGKLIIYCLECKHFRRIPFK